MEIIADLHLHSKYSRAVSQQMVIPEIAKWARKKGIDLVSAPDWTHPLFFRELKKDLVEVGRGVFAYREDPNGPKFILVTEISSIYSQGGKTRRIHTLFFAPSLAIVEKINEILGSRGVKLMSDGRPVTGLSVRELAKLVFSVSDDCLVVPSHLWTPWFSTYGDKGGFDSLREAYGDLTGQIFAIETGLSSDPAMNWRIEELDNRSIVSFSDAHSPAKLGREATVFEFGDRDRDREISYEDIRQAIVGDQAGSNLPGLAEAKPRAGQSRSHILYTIEFYPEEGKYHWTGHRNCQVRQSPSETQKLGATCPVCGKKLTVGVMHRVEQLAGREGKAESKKGETGIKWTLGSNRPSYVMLVPLLEILSEVENVGVSSQKVENEYNRLTDHFGGEFTLLLKTPISEIAKIGGERLAEAIEKVRGGNIFVDPGYDGVFGKVKIWGEEEKKEEKKQMTLF
jgi:uncharacterized protein (TIGR00375 family)